MIAARAMEFQGASHVRKPFARCYFGPSTGAGATPEPNVNQKLTGPPRYTTTDRLVRFSYFFLCRFLRPVVGTRKRLRIGALLALLPGVQTTPLGALGVRTLR